MSDGLTQIGHGLAGQAKQSPHVLPEILFVISDFEEMAKFGVVMSNAAKLHMAKTGQESQDRVLFSGYKSLDRRGPGLGLAIAE